ncbi:hypothetical protein F511_05592 [Dorcoceras hygrometricum]|uniref:RING-type E3 ubiquitin transferase n=1 Tax=Dorcoceras hygrometricum TaxID=472368 RepID=A0A2Z7ARS2_9LAMI|nr:hypothetical protein F511_05592 [Dorcoceras hygrometricum]
MKILQPTFFFLFFVSFVHAKKQCPTYYCGSNSTLPIRFPFKLQDNQPQNCSYTFLTCNDQATAIINLPYAGDFYVRSIDYDSLTIKLYDPNNCLPKRFMSFNLSSSFPSEVSYYQNYTFYSCPKELVEIANLTFIGCLSNSSTATVATSVIGSRAMKELYRCNEITTSLIPVSVSDSYGFVGNQTEFVLTWFPFSCNGCPNSTGLVPPDILAAAFIILWMLPIILAPLICISCCVHFIKEVRLGEGGENKSSKET